MEDNLNSLKIYRGGDWIMSPTPHDWSQTHKYLVALGLRRKLIDSSVKETYINHEEVDYSVAEFLSKEESLKDRHPNCKFLYVWISEETLMERVIKRYDRNRWLETLD